MKYYNLFICLLLSSCSLFKSAPSMCEMLKLETCNESKRSLSRSSGASAPTTNSAAFSNPAAIALSKGLGIETIQYAGSTQIGIVTGTGRIGAAISNNPSDGTFFGNTPFETIEEQRFRAISGLKFEDDRLVLAGGFNLFGADKKKGLQMDLGVMYRRQDEINKDYYGAGVSFSISKVFSFGASYYNDIFYRNLANKSVKFVDQNGNITDFVYPATELPISLTYTVLSQFASLKIWNFAFDIISFTTVLDEDEIEDYSTQIYNVSYFYGTWIFSYGHRKEISDRETWDGKVFTWEREKEDPFAGTQYSTKGGFLLGVFYNYYLVQDVSFGLTYFF